MESRDIKAINLPVTGVGGRPVVQTYYTRYLSKGQGRQEGEGLGALSGGKVSLPSK